MSKRPGSKIPSSVVSSRSEVTDTQNGRQRQNKRDEAIRKKLEQELSKKRATSSTRGSRQTRKIAGTVSALRPAQALTIKENMLVIESAQLMAAKRSDCVLVVDDDDHLSGIFTAKDLAYRVVAENLDARSTPVAAIMTKNPQCVTSDTSATDALNLMVSRGFRHLPVCNEEGDIFGVLDITKCLYEALDKMERAYGSSRKLYDALEGVEREWSASPVQLVQYMEALRDRMSCPDLNTVWDNKKPVEVKYTMTVRDIAHKMKENHTTAVLVTKHHKLAGIFTTKDIVLRVIAAGLAPDTCSVVRVMTPNPDTATRQTTILEALRRMHDGHYLNLPIVEDGTAIGMVDVLKLTYATLEQMNTIQGTDGEGPMWTRFWDSFGSADDTDNASQTSDYQSSSRVPVPVSAISPEPSMSLSQLQDFSEILPHESASMVNHHTNEDAQSNLSSHHSPSTRIANEFHFKLVLPSTKMSHRFNSACQFAPLLDAVRQKLATERLPPQTLNSPWTLAYLDDENDEVSISCDADVTDAVEMAHKLQKRSVTIYVRFAADTNSPLSVPASSLASPIQSVTVPPLSVQDTTPLEALTDSDDEPVYHKSRSRKSAKTSAANGLSPELLLPAAIAFLGVVIVGVFAVSRVAPHRH